MRWTITPPGNTQYKIIALESGRALDINAASMVDSAQAIIWDYADANNQQWTIAPTSGGYFTVKAVHSGKALEVNAAATIDDARVQQWTANGGLNQQWAFQAP
jgi:hypothetical protein